jgi:hypothetical protein
MPYSTTGDVKALTGTTLDDTDIALLIEQADSEIDAVLAREGLSIAGSTTPLLINLASKYLASSLVLQREWASGATPDSYRIGDFSQQTRIAEQIAGFEKRGKGFLEEYIRRSRFDATMFYTIVEDKTNVED